MIDEALTSGPRSLLFVPGDRADRYFPGALTSGADAVILDLEDGVGPDRKSEARAVIEKLGAEHTDKPSIIVRVNAPKDGCLSDDLAAAAAVRPHAILIPKCEASAEVAATKDASRGAGLPADLPLIATVETPLGVMRAHEIATAEGVVGMAFGGEDFAAAVGIPSDRSAVTDYARCAVVVAAAAAGIWAVDSPTTNYRNIAILRRDSAAAVSLGFVGKLLIHPSQVNDVHAAFDPSAEEVNRARQTVEGSGRKGGGRGAYGAEGRMVDKPVVMQAQRVLARARRMRRLNREQGGET